MELKNTAVIKCRGIILHEDKIFVVKHRENSGFYAFPGGHLEFLESPIECIGREMKEEFGVIPEVGKLLYVNSFENPDGTNFFEFFFEIKNGADYLDIAKLNIQKDEIFEILWVGKNENIKILPEKIYQDFNNGTIGVGDVQFIN
ncbi:MAG: NUDIX hydrolase [bacterium]